jgi:hypothetical protein
MGAIIIFEERKKKKLLKASVRLHFGFQQNAGVFDSMERDDARRGNVASGWRHGFAHQLALPHISHRRQGKNCWLAFGSNAATFFIHVHRHCRLWDMALTCATAKTPCNGLFRPRYG